MKQLINILLLALTCLAPVGPADGIVYPVPYHGLQSLHRTGQELSIRPANIFWGRHRQAKHKAPRHRQDIHYYRNVHHVRVQSPTRYDQAPAGASAQCRDMTYSFSQSRRGTCSHHGGVLRWLK